MIETREIEAKSILIKSNLPDSDYVINPYTGCEFGCHYCYASFMCRYAGKDISEWGNFVYIKKNAVELLKKKLNRFKDWHATIFFSSVTDPYQGIEAKHKLTRQLLEVLLKHQYPGKISILTKSNLVTRDIDLFDNFKNIEVGLTITSTDDKISRFMEVRASNVNARLNTLKKLNDANIKTFAFIGPLLPHFSLAPEKLDSLFKAIAETGTKEVYVEHLNMKPYILKRLGPILKTQSQRVNDIYSKREKIDLKVHELLKKHSLKLKTDETIKHEST